MSAASVPWVSRLSVRWARLIVVAGAFFSLVAIVLVPRGLVQTTGQTGLLVAGVALAAVCVALLAIVTDRPAFERFTARLERVPLVVVLLIGVLLQAALAYGLHPVQSSDAGNYLGLARALANGEPYRTPEGLLAFWPPGLPFFLLPFVAILGPDLHVVLAANIVLYVSAAIALYFLCTALFDRRTASIAVILLTLWPCRAFISTIASKEMLTLTLMTIGLAMAVHIDVKSTVRSNCLRAIALGLALGMSALTQPGLTLLFAVFPIAFFFRWSSLSPRYFLGLLILVLAAFACVAGPWMLRNHRVFDGAFSGISTNGGSVFYRANNDLASAEYSARGTIDLAPLSELEANAVGFRLGKEWILANPRKEAALAARKFAALLDSDSHGYYWAIQRRHGTSQDVSARSMTPNERTAVVVAQSASYAFWVLLCGAVAIRCFRARAADALRVAPMLYPFLYCCVVFTIFESGPRQHIFAVPALIALAASTGRKAS